MNTPTKREICWMLTELRDTLEACGVPTMRADKPSEFTTGIIIPVACIQDVKKIIEEGEHPAEVQYHGVCGMVVAVY